MTLTTEVAKKIIRKLIHGQDYRIEVVTLLDAEFLQYATRQTPLAGALCRQTGSSKLKRCKEQ